MNKITDCGHFLSPDQGTDALPAAAGHQRQSGNRYALPPAAVKRELLVAAKDPALERRFLRGFGHCFTHLQQRLQEQGHGAEQAAIQAQGLCNLHLAGLLLERPSEALPPAFALVLEAEPESLPLDAGFLADIDPLVVQALGPEALSLAHEHVVLQQAGNRKAAGAFYTPAPLARYLCRQALGGRLAAVLPGSGALSAWLEGGAGVEPLLGAPARTALVGELSGLCICDPTAGAGAFLAAMLEELYSLLTALGQRPDRLLLLRQLHGVDLDAAALRCCKARLLLELAQAGAGSEELLRAAEIMASRIRPGDSLLESRSLTHPGFSWPRDFSEAMQRGGFDVFVGNPPFLRIQRIPAELRQAYRELFKTAKGKYDAAGLFVEQCLRLCAPRASLVFVLPSRLFTAAHGQALREYLRLLCCSLSVQDMQDVPLFGQAAGYAALAGIRLDAAEQAVCQETPPVFPPGHGRNKSRSYEPLERLCSHICQGLISGGDRWFHLQDCGETSEEAGNALRLVRAKSGGKPFWLEDFLLEPLLKGRDVRRYTPPKPSLLALYPYDLQDLGPRARLLEEDFLRREAPHAWRYFESHGQELASRGSAGMRYPARHACWCPRRPWIFAQPKLLVRTLARRAAFTLDPGREGGGGYIFTGGGNAGVYGLIPGPSPLGQGPEALLYLLALLNATALQEMTRRVSSRFRGGYLSFGRRYIAPLPIAMPRPGELRELAALAAAAMAATDSREHEEQMDRLTSRLYT